MQNQENELNDHPVQKKAISSRIKTILLLMLGFATLVLVNLTLTEQVKKLVATTLGYRSGYHPPAGRYYYSNNEHEAEKKRIVERYNYEDDFFDNDPEWKSYTQRNQKSLAIIHWSGRLFLIVISIIGLAIYFLRRRKEKLFGPVDWITLFLGLFFMKDVAMDCMGIVFRIHLNDMVIWTYFGLPYKSLSFVWVIIGFLLFFFILYKLPKGYFWMFIVCGFIGSFAGAFLWFNAMHKMHRLKHPVKELTTGDIAANFTAIVHGNNDSFYFNKYRDSIVVLDFFFTTCGPCRRAIPHVNTLHAKYRARGVVFFGVDPLEDDQKRLDRFLAKVQVDYPILKADKMMADTYGVYGFPTVFVINKGRIVLRLSGCGDDFESNIRQKLEEVLKGH